MSIKNARLYLTFLCMLLWCLLSATAHAAPFTVLLNPAGDAQMVGRTIDNHFERSLTLQCAQSIQKIFQESNVPITIIISRKAGEAIPFLQNAHFANCLAVDLFISIHFYYEEDVIPHFFMYAYRDINSFMRIDETLSLYPYYYAYLYHQQKTMIYAQQCVRMLHMFYDKKQCIIHDPLYIPVYPLIGVAAPALMVEIGLKKSSDCLQYSTALAQMIIHVLTEL